MPHGSPNMQHNPDFCYLSSRHLCPREASLPTPPHDIPGQCDFCFLFYLP